MCLHVQSDAGTKWIEDGLGQSVVLAEFFCEELRIWIPVCGYTGEFTLTKVDTNRERLRLIKAEQIFIAGASLSFFLFFEP